MIYKMIKKLIENKKYNKEELQRKLDVFLLANRITEEEYQELTAMLTA